MAKRVSEQREKVAGRINRKERVGSPYKRSIVSEMRGCVITPRHREAEKKASIVSLVELSREEGRKMKRTLTLTNDQEMKDFSERAALSRTDYMLKKLQNKEKHIEQLDYEYTRGEGEVNIFSCLSASSNSSPRGRLSPIESRRDSGTPPPARTRRSPGGRSAMSEATRPSAAWSLVHGYLGLPSQESAFNYKKKVALM